MNSPSMASTLNRRVGRVENRTPTSVEESTYLLKIAPESLNTWPDPWERAREDGRGGFAQPLAGVPLEQLLGNVSPCPRCGCCVVDRDDPPHCAQCGNPSQGIEHWQVVW